MVSGPIWSGIMYAFCLNSLEKGSVFTRDLWFLIAQKCLSWIVKLYISLRITDMQNTDHVETIVLHSLVYNEACFVLCEIGYAFLQFGLKWGLENYLL